MWTTAMKWPALLSIALGAGGLAAAPVSLHWSSMTKTLSVSLDRANAKIGHPLSPVSVAGVHRRTARRAYYGAAAIGAAGAYYGVAGSNYGYGYGYSPYSNSGYGNLYAYSPSANAGTANAGTVNAGTQESSYSTGPSTNSGGTGSDAQSSTEPSLSPELHAFCVYRTYGACTTP
jgi:hypothetical protein